MDNRLYTVTATGFDPYYNLAMEAHLLDRVCQCRCILYLWQNEHTVVIGRNQNPWAECRTSLLQEEGGRLARRLSGGGAVYHDLGNLNFTFLCKAEDYDLQKQLSVIQKAVAYAGIQAEFSGRNDLLADGKKFSGNAFYHSKGAAYHHGTLLVNANIEHLQRYLSPSKAKLESKGIASVRSRVVNLQALSPSLTCERMKDYMLRAFAEVYGGQPAELSFTRQDTEEILRRKAHFQSEEWLFGKSIPFSCTLEGYFSFGSMQLRFAVEQGVIVAVQCFTDAMDSNLPQKLSDALTGCSFQADTMANALSSLDIGPELSSFIRQQI